MMRCRLIFILAVTIGGQCLATPKSLGITPPEKGDSIAFDMNTAGQIAAVLQDENGDQRAVLVDQNKQIQIGTLGGHQSNARRINRQGEVVGSANRQDGTWGAYVYRQSTGMQDLGTLGGANSHGMAINNHGEVVGFSDLPNHEWHAFLYRPGEPMKDLGTLGGKISYANGINDRGQIVGTALLADKNRHAFIYDAKHGMVDLGTLGGRFSYASSINESGVVVGASETAHYDWHAFVYDGKKMRDLGVLFGQWDSYPVAINNAGHVVGTLKLNDHRMSFVWRDGVMAVHRNGLSGLYLVNSINDAGQVIGATLGLHLNAATMLANTPAPHIDPESLTSTESHMLFCLLVVLVMIIAVIVMRGRYRGIVLREQFLANVIRRK